MAQSPTDSLTIRRVAYPKYLSDQIKPDDWLIDNTTYQLIRQDLDSIPRFKQFESKFSELQRANDSLFAEVRKQFEIIENLYNKADILQRKVLHNQLELYRAEEEVKELQARYNVNADQQEKEIRYRTRYIFRDRQEKRWFWVTWGIFIAVPASIVIWQTN